MPKINRVRIVNFAYNNNNRHIIDECFDFYGGENALLSLANGGGKSVLVQAMLQPILPRVSLLGRKFGDFFIGKRTPSYIMTEWKLDDEADYLLTGIAVTSRVSQSANEEEENTGIKYFTFLNVYEKANQFDIQHIPVAEQVGSSVRIASYNEFNKLLQKESGRNHNEISVYDSTREEQSMYERKLNSYSISKEEWKELIVNINEAENGVSEVFSECRTSRRVMEQWIIKYIEKVLDKSADTDATDHNKLETMMTQVAQSLVDNENHIREYNAIEGFHRELGTIYNDAKAVLTQLDREDKLKKKISGGYQVLKGEEDRLRQELVDIESCLKELGGEFELISLEEKSQEIYEYAKKLEEAEKRLSEVRELIKGQKLQLDGKIYKRDMQKAAGKYGSIRQKEKEIAELQQRFENASKDQEELLKNLNRIKYSLKIAYNSQILSVKKEIDGVNADFKSVLDGIGRNRSGIEECQAQINKLNKDIGGVDREIVIFEKEEPELLASLGIQIFRNPLLKELDQQDIMNAESQLSKEFQAAEMLLVGSRDEMDKLKNTFSDLRQNKDELSQNHTELKVEESEIAAGIKSFNDEKQKLLDTLKRLNINTEYLFDAEYLEKAAKEYLNDWENKSYHLKMEISELDKQIHSIKNGVSYLPASLTSLLKERNLPCYTGEKYLREINEEDKKRLLIENPILPYALIATEKEITQIEQLVTDMELNQIIPVVRHSQKEQGMDSGYEKVQFITSSKSIYLDNKDVEAFINSLMEKKADRMFEQQKADEVIDRVNHDYQLIVNFGWTEKQVRELEIRQKRNEEEICKNYQAAQACTEQMEDIIRKQEELAAQIEDFKTELADRQKRIKGFGDYLAKNSKYMENVHLNLEIQSKINSLSAARKKHENDKAALEAREKELRNIIEGKNRNKKDIENKLTEVAGAAEVELINASVPELEGRFEANKKQQNNEAADLDARIKGLKKDIQDDEKDIKKWKLESEEYKNIEYSESMEAELEAQCDELGEEIEGLKKDETAHLLTESRLNERIKIAHEALGSKAIVPVESIRGNFAKRREEVERKRHENQARQSKAYNDRLELTGLISKAESEIKGIQFIKTEIEQNVIRHKTFEEVKVSINSMLEEYGKFTSESNESIQLFDKSSSQFINRYMASEEGTVKEAVKGLQHQIDALDRSYEKYYYLTERMDYYFEQLSQILKIMESKILQLEHSQKDLTEHAFVEASRIYHEIPKISENSAVDIDGVRKKVLEIQYEEMGDELQAREKMGTYIQDCLQSLTKLIKEKDDDNRLRREVEKYMSTKELLNIISKLENCRIKAYKVDLNEKNRRMMLWEDIIIKNSGGEKFVAYFSLLVALISYSRKQIKGYDAFKRKEESKVLIMDNPFGPITSGHLLKPMFDIAKKYNTQLICLSDIKQGAVVNSFDLIYMIKIRQNMMREDFLELEPVLLKELKQDERLENAHLFGKLEQVSLFE